MKMKSLSENIYNINETEFPLNIIKKVQIVIDFSVQMKYQS